MSEMFLLWFRKSLENRNIDPSYEEYLCSILRLEATTQRIDYLIDAIETISAAEDNIQFCHKILEFYETPSSCVDELISFEEQTFPLPDVKNNREIVSESITESKDFLLDYNNHYSTEYNDEDMDQILQDELNEYHDENEVDWAALADNLEMKLLELNPNIIYSAEAIFSALDLCEHKIDAACKCIKTAEANISSVKPCRHMLTGRCMRRDCMFDHEVSHIVCRYWMTTGCTLDFCPFLHRFPPGDYFFPPKIETFQFKSNSSDFPSLPTSKEEAFPALPSKQRQAVSVKISSQTNTSKLKELDLQFHFASRNKALVSSSSKPVVGCVSSEKRGTQAALLLPTEWVSSGSVVSATYQQHREEARRFAIARNKFLEEATKAYVAGQKSIAKNLSANGQDMAEKMRQSHREAAKNIFSLRNDPDQIAKGVLDMHGLHVEEAKECMLNYIHYFRQLRLPYMTIITGTGHHSKGPNNLGSSRLMQMVQAVCKEQGLLHNYVVDGKGFHGALKITF